MTSTAVTVSAAGRLRTGPSPRPSLTPRPRPGSLPRSNETPSPRWHGGTDDDPENSQPSYRQLSRCPLSAYAATALNPIKKEVNRYD